MSFSWLSIMGMYEYDPSVMDGLKVPEGMDKETVVNNILLNCAELEVIYSRIESMKLAIKVWSDSNQIGWKKLYDTMTVEYNPIWNVDADITDTETISGSNTQTRTGTDSRDITRNLTGSDNETVNLNDNRTINTADNETVNLTDTKSVQGFNSASWASAEKIDKTGTDNIAHTGTDNIAHTGTDNIAHTQNERIDDDLSSTESISGENDTSRTYTQRRTGNIGVTTTQQMLEQERAIAEFNMVEYITESFKKRFCLMIY